jgi:hypothetical protein
VHASLKTPHPKKLIGKGRRKEYIAHASYVTPVISLKTLREKA